MAIVAIDAHVVTGFPQGSRTYLENVLDWLGRLDPVNRYQIYSYDPAATRRRFPFANFDHISIGLRSSIPRLLLYWPLAKLRHRFDVLVTQYILPPLVPGPHFVVTHDILPQTHPDLFAPFMRWRSQLLFRMSARRARRIFVVSRYTKRAVSEHYGIDPAKIDITYNGFDRSAVARTGTGRRDVDAGNYVLFVGRLEPRKNVALVIDAMALVKTPGLRFLVVGGARSATAELLARLADTPRVEHLANVDDAALDRLYRGARALVYPSRAEGFGLPVIEALARGVPVITSDQTALPEVGGPFARYLDPGAPDAARRLAALIDDVCRSPMEIDGEALRAHLAQFDWEASARTILRRINELA